MTDSVFKNLKAYAIGQLLNPNDETDLITVQEDYAFGDFYFFDNVDECMKKYEDMISNGKKVFVLNNHALLFKFLEHEREMRALKLGITSIEYEVKQ